MGLLIIVLNYKAFDKTEECVLSILKSTNIDFSVLIVDNDIYSKDVKRIENKFKPMKNVFVVSTNKNIGYANGNNFGFQWAKKNGIIKRDLLILNNDITIQNVTDLFKVQFEFNSIPDIGVLSPKIIHKKKGMLQGPYKNININMVIIESYLPFLKYIRLKQEEKWRENIDKTTKVERTMGSFLYLSSALFEKVGGFDKNTFLGSEEEIFAEKLKLQNKYFYYFPGVSVLHDHKYSTQKLGLNVTKRHFRNSKLYFYKNYKNANPTQLLLLKLAFLLNDFWKSLFRR